MALRNRKSCMPETTTTLSWNTSCIPSTTFSITQWFLLYVVGTCLHLLLVFVGCTGCIPRAGEGPRADQEAGADAEGNSWLALPAQVPEDAVQLCRTTDVHAWIPVTAEVRTGELGISCHFDGIYLPLMPT